MQPALATNEERKEDYDLIDFIDEKEDMNYIPHTLNLPLHRTLPPHTRPTEDPLLDTPNELLSSPLLKPTISLQNHSLHTTSSSSLDCATQFPENEQFNQTSERNGSEIFTDNSSTKTFQHVLQYKVFSTTLTVTSHQILHLEVLVFLTFLLHFSGHLLHLVFAGVLSQPTLLCL